MVLLSGFTGFVGRNLSDYLLSNGIECDDLLLRSNSWPSQLKLGYDAIIHLAGKAHDTSNLSSSEEYYSVNRDLTISLFDKFLESGIRDFFYFSSVKAVADAVDGVLTEEVEGRPLTPYGKSKLEAEEYILSKELPEGKRLFIIRPCMIHGPGNKGNLNLLYNVVKLGIPWPLGSFDNKRSYLSIDNLCFLINLMLGNSTLSSGIYNFSDDKPLSTNELVTIISKSLGRKDKILKINKMFVSSIAKIGDKISLPLNTERLKKLTESYVVSNEKVKSALGIKELPISVEEGLKRTILSFSN